MYCLGQRFALCRLTHFEMMRMEFASLEWLMNFSVQQIVRSFARSFLCNVQGLLLHSIDITNEMMEIILWYLHICYLSYLVQRKHFIIILRKMACHYFVFLLLIIHKCLMVINYLTNLASSYCFSYLNFEICEQANL